MSDNGENLSNLTQALRNFGTVGPSRGRIKNNLPSTESLQIFGREEETRLIQGYLQPYPQSQYPTVTLDGVGGVGKSALALSIASFYVYSDSLSDYAPFDAIVWTSAKRQVLTKTGIQTQQPSLRNLRDVILAIGLTLDRPDILAATPDEQGELTRHALSQSRVLLIFDNLETVDDSQVMSFIRDLPAPTKAIITTRHRIDGSITIRLTGLGEPAAMDLVDHLISQEGLDHVSRSERQEISEAANGLPLAIAWTIGQIAFGRSIRSAVSALKSAKGEFAAFCFQEAYDLLRHNHDAMRLLLSLSYFVDGSTRDVLGRVAGMGNSVDSRDRALTDLLKLSLVNFREGRFSLLPLTRQYVLAELARDLEFQEQSKERWLDWAVSAAKISADGGADLDQAVIQALQEEYSNIMWAADLAFRERDMDRWAAILRGMEFFWLGTGLWQEFQQNLSIARSVVPKAEDRLHFSLRLAWLYVLRGQVSDAEEMFETAAALLRQNPSRYEEMRYWDFCGQLELERGNYAESLDCFGKSLEIARELGDVRGRCACTKYSGEATLLLGDLEGAKRWLVAAELEMEQVSARWLRGIAHTLHLRGLCELASGNYAGAITAFRSAAETLVHWPDQRLLSKVKLGLADALYCAGKFKEARQVLSESREILELLGMRGAVAQVDARIQELREHERAEE